MRVRRLTVPQRHCGHVSTNMRRQNIGQPTIHRLVASDGRTMSDKSGAMVTYEMQRDEHAQRRSQRAEGHRELGGAPHHGQRVQTDGCPQPHHRQHHVHRNGRMQPERHCEACTDDKTTVSWVLKATSKACIALDDESQPCLTRFCRGSSLRGCKSHRQPMSVNLKEGPCEQGRIRITSSSAD